MQWICYIAGLSRKKEYVVIQIALTPEPKVYLDELKQTQPYELKLLGREVGDLNALEERRARFKSSFKNGWVKPTPALLEYIENLPPPDPDAVKPKKVCLEWDPLEVKAIDRGADLMGIKTRAKLIRRAVRFYLGLTAYHAKGWTIQAVKGGRFVAFKGLDGIEDPSEVPDAHDIPKVQ